MKLTKRIKHSLPNSSGDMFSLIHRSSAEARGNPHWKIRLIQLIGGTTWSLAFIRNEPMDHITPGKPIETVFAEHSLEPDRTLITEYQARLDYATEQTDKWVEAAERRRYRVFELIDIQYGMVYDIADLMNSLYEDIRDMQGKPETKHGIRIAKYMFEDLAGLCPDQDPMIETPK